MNGGTPQKGEHMLEVGSYNSIIAPNEYYSPEYSDFASTHKTFKRMMPFFAWEVLEVYSGPPKVAFRWRHWGQMKNDYVGFNKYGCMFPSEVNIAYDRPVEPRRLRRKLTEDGLIYRASLWQTWMRT